jgi:hypothetical protein
MTSYAPNAVTFFAGGSWGMVGPQHIIDAGTPGKGFHVRAVAYRDDLLANGVPAMVGHMSVGIPDGPPKAEVWRASGVPEDQIGNAHHPTLENWDGEPLEPGAYCPA